MNWKSISQMRVACQIWEFILRAYEKWGEDFLCHLTGAFAIALWDDREQRLLLARSPLGERSLCYHNSEASFAFASMPKGLFALPGVNREIDLDYLADYLVAVPKDSGSTFYSGIHRLPAGHCLTIRRDGTKLRRYWQPDTGRELRLPSDEDYVDAFNELFQRVIADHMRSATPVGVMMSGGLDSHPWLQLPPGC